MFRASLLVSAGVLLGFAVSPFAGSLVAPALADETIVVVEHATTDTTVDLGDEGDSVGDTLTFANDIYDTADVNQVGTDEGSCTRTVVGKSWHCNWTVYLDGGQIVVEGPFKDDGDSTLAIVGGTGDYANASGEMILEATGDARYRFTFNVED